jgi:hypothetical protein
VFASGFTGEITTCSTSSAPTRWCSIARPRDERVAVRQRPRQRRRATLPIVIVSDTPEKPTPACATARAARAADSEAVHRLADRPRLD